LAGFQIAELALHADARVNRFEDKAGFSSRQILDEDDTRTVNSTDVVRPSDIVDLTKRMHSDGSLVWTPPPGRWVVLRFGYSLLGRTNHPTSEAESGLEVDKLNEEHAKAYMDAYMDELQKAIGPSLIERTGLRYMVMDSYEAGAQNWTDDMLDQFRNRRGYDALRWLPVLAGRVVESASASDQFLWDFRRTIAELMAAHYAQVSSSLRAHGLGLYAESHEYGRTFIGDGMEVKKHADIPMGAMWAARAPGRTQEDYDADIRESASVAHIYGKPLIAAESFTAYGNTYGFSPETLKPIADRELALGANRFVIHTSVHQPDNRPGPGIGLGPFGQWFTRKETWAEQASGWIAYLARSSYLLQQGRFVADIAYLYGEDSNVTSLFVASAAPIPEGINFDFVNPDAFLGEMSAKDGKLVTSGGMEYRVLALDPSTHRMSLAMLRKIRDLVRAGAVVVGAKPTGTPSLADNADEFRAIVTELWGSTAGEQAAGPGKVIADRSLGEVLAASGISPDVIFLKAPDAAPRFVHRTLGDGELYFISSDVNHRRTVEASFRVSGRTPELWRADTGTITSLSYRVEDGRTVIPLQLEANDAAFVVFREQTAQLARSVFLPIREKLSEVGGPWQVRFQAGRGAPDQASFGKLESWTANADPAIKYFSGTADYETNITVPASWLISSHRVDVDLGVVKDLAEVIVNGKSAGVLWKTPFRIDVTHLLRPGVNRLVFRITNLWPNRLIGDRQAGATPVAVATFNPYATNSPLLESGLIGPVTLEGSKE
jgi:hypothetical protein